MVKNTRFKEHFDHQFKVEMVNALNHPHFAAPGSTIGTATAGVISSLLYNTPMRQIQLAMKLSFGRSRLLIDSDLVIMEAEV